MSTLRNVHRAQIAPAKLRDYVLNPEHPDGASKAVYFAEMGFVRGNWELLEQAIRQQHLNQPAVPGQTSPYGVKFEITAPITGPNGVTRNVTTVWIYKIGQDYPSLVTVLPGPKRGD